MNVTEIEILLKTLADEAFDLDTFPYRFIECFDAPKATVTKLRQGTMNKAKIDGELLWPKKLYFCRAREGEAATTLDSMARSPLVKTHSPRFLLTTDGKEFSAIDTKIDETRHDGLSKLNDHFDLFLPLAGIERYEAVAENPADIKAAGRLAKLYDAILAANADWIAPDHTHALNLFMTRLLFCMFAEDTGIFKTDLFVQSVNDCTHVEGGDVASYLKRIFDIMDTEPSARGDEPDFVTRFPYVNGGLFRDRTEVPKFSKLARRILLETARLNWAEINPDIFGSMIQAVVEPEMRGDLGMHYTSVPNIMKVLQPLFILDLEEEFEVGRDNCKKMEKLLNRIANIRVFDPACGSGNFLIIAYRELRKLEMRILTRISDISDTPELPFSRVKIHQFSGIEYAGFACETAKLSLWFAEFQMNERFKSLFGEAPPPLPLKEGGNIVNGNAATINWSDVCSRNNGGEIKIVGNPPYIWSGDRNQSQKLEMELNFGREAKSFKVLDYVAIWFIKAAEFCQGINAEFAFVSTNSICQGEQAGVLWPILFNYNLEIGFAHQSFKWRNLAAKNAGVSCVIINLRNRSNKHKVLFSSDHSRVVSNIGPYLIEMKNIVVKKSPTPVFGQPEMVRGNMPYDGGHLILSPEEKHTLERNYPKSKIFLRRLYGSHEVINGAERWCLWIEDEHIDAAMAIKPIADRIEKVRIGRLSNKDNSVVKLADRPHQFRETNSPKDFAVVVPAVSSEGREVLPCAMFGTDSTVTNRCYQILDPSPAMFAIIVSRMHYVWADTVGGKLETRFNYSNTIIYNNFPMLNLTSEQKLTLEQLAWEIIAEREAEPGKTIAWLYNPKTMPENLRLSHNKLDGVLENFYIGRRFINDTERLEHLFKLYVEITGTNGVRND